MREAQTISWHGERLLAIPLETGWVIWRQDHPFYGPAVFPDEAWLVTQDRLGAWLDQTLSSPRTSVR